MAHLSSCTRAALCASWVATPGCLACQKRTLRGQSRAFENCWVGTPFCDFTMVRHVKLSTRCNTRCGARYTPSSLHTWCACLDIHTAAVAAWVRRAHDGTAPYVEVLGTSPTASSPPRYSKTGKTPDLVGKVFRPPASERPITCRPSRKNLGWSEEAGGGAWPFGVQRRPPRAAFGRWHPRQNPTVRSSGMHLSSDPPWLRAGWGRHGGCFAMQGGWGGLPGHP